MTMHTGGCPTRRLPRAKSRGRFCREWGCSAGKVMLHRSALAVGVSLVAVLLLVSAQSVGQQRDQERVEFGRNIRRAPTAALHGEVVSFGRGWLLLPILIMVAILWLVIALIVWLITRGRRAPAPGQPVRQA